MNDRVTHADSLKPKGPVDTSASRQQDIGSEALPLRGSSETRRNGISPLQQQIDTQNALAPVLHPSPSLSSIIKNACSDELLCSALFDNRPCDFCSLWHETHADDDVPVCYYCGEEVERVELKKLGSFVLLYTFLVADRQIQVEGVQVICSACQRVKRLEQLLPLCGEAIACQTATSFPKLESLATRTLFRQTDVQPAELVNSIVQHFLQVNNLDPVRHITAFQNALSLGLAIFTTSRQTQWKLKTPKTRPQDLFVI